MMNLKLTLISLVTVLFLASCAQEKNHNQEVDNSVSYTQEILKYAKGFEVYFSKDGRRTKIIVNDLERGEGALQTIFLHQNKLEKKTKSHFSVPLGDISVASTTHASFMLSLGLEKNIKGMAWASYAQNEILKGQIKSGETTNITGSSEVDLEKLLATNSIAYTNYPFGMDENGKLATLDLPVIVVSEYLEDSPLARAEWIKFFGHLYGKSREANEIFNALEKEYLALKEKVASKNIRPTVVIGSEQNGVWHMPGADSFISQMISDAGGAYLFSDIKGKNNQQVDLEILIQRASEVNFWGKITNKALTRENLQKENKKLQSISAVKEGQVFFCNTTKSDYFGMAIMEPHLILKDMVRIFHPDVLEVHEQKYFSLVE